MQSLGVLIMIKGITFILLVAGSDFEPIEMNVIIEAGEEQGCFVIEIIPDELFEENEYFTIIITGAEENVHVYTENITVHIEDDNSK